VEDLANVFISMRKFLCCIFLVSLSGQALAQVSSQISEGYRQGSLDWRTRRDFSYDSEGNVVLMDNDGWHDGQWVDCCRNEYVYDEEGRRVERTLLHPLRPGWRFGSQTTWWFSQDGRAETETGRNWEDGKWQNSSGQHQTSTLRLTEYTETSEVSTTQVWQDGSWKNLWRLIIEYDALGRIASSLQQDWELESWRNLSLGEYDRTDNPADTSRIQTSFNWENGAREPYKRSSSLGIVGGQAANRIWEDWVDSA